MCAARPRYPKSSQTVTVPPTSFPSTCSYVLVCPPPSLKNGHAYPFLTYITKVTHDDIEMPPWAASFSSRRSRKYLVHPVEASKGARFAFNKYFCEMLEKRCAVPWGEQQTNFLAIQLLYYVAAEREHNRGDQGTTSRVE